MPISTYWRRLGYVGLWLFIAFTVGLLVARNTYDVQGLVVVLLAACLLGYIVLRRAASKTEGFVFGIIVLGLLLKVAASFVRLYVATDLYGGVADAIGYDGRGRILAEQIRDLNFAALAPYMEWGTETMSLATGVVYAIIGSTFPGAYVVFGLFAFCGAHLYYQAFRTAFPQASHKFYAILVFLSPSLVFWPNGMSKDALIFFFMGIVAYGCARVLRKLDLVGAVVVVAGLLGTMSVRPHIAGILAIALAVAFGLRAVRRSITNPLPNLAGLMACIFLAWFFVPKALEFTGLGSLDFTSTMDYLELRQTQTLQGGSAFQVPDVTSPLGFLMAFVTVLFRPFPWEAHNIQTLIQALDGVLLLGLVIGTSLWRGSRVLRNSTSLLGQPYALFIVLYTIMFVVAFTSISNFGILARQRAQVLPLFLMLVVFLASSTVSNKKVEDYGAGPEQGRLSPVP